MPYLLNLLYLVVLVAISPWLAYKALTTGKYRRGLGSKFLGWVDPTPPVHHPINPAPRQTPGANALGSPHPGSHPVCWFHGVSVGEIHLLRQVVACFRRHHPHWECVISTSTDTGMQEARKHFPDLPVIYWPLDFSWAVHRALRLVHPSLVVLAEGEMWPNFVMAAKERGIPVAVVNGRMSPRSFFRYQWLGWLVRWVFRQVDLFAVRADEYADCFLALGAAPERIHVTGNVKFDGVVADRQNARTEEMARLLDVWPDDLVWIAGSTQAPEEEMAIDIFPRAKGEHPNLRLFIVPRQKDRFEEVARLLQQSRLPWVRRSSLTEPLMDRDAIVLVDTIGEFGALWGLADVAFVGGSFDGRRGGQNMIEPAAYGCAVVFGPHVWNFREEAVRLVDARAAIQVREAARLEETVRQLFREPGERQHFGAAARRFVLQQQGATEQTIALLGRLIATDSSQTRAA